MKSAAITVFVFIVLVPFFAVAEKQHNWETATVISQNLNTYNAGAVAMPVGNGAVAVPIRRQANIVLVETDTQRLTWSEVFRKHPIILTVNGMVRFYRDGDWFIVLDSKGKEHKFGLVGMANK